MSVNVNQNCNENENACVVCFKNVEIYSVGVCDHPVCFECSSRMRILCRQNECPICRQDMPKVIFSLDVEPFQIKIQTQTNLMDSKFGLIFCTAAIKRAYDQLLEHNCYKCSKQKRPKPFRTFVQLKDHMRHEHELFYCDLCVENLKIFTFERRCYTRVELGQHRRKGDLDNTSHRGHPLCEFCDHRYMDSDELFRHLRRDHFYCHFCDADGKHEYYDRYVDLRAHFQSAHFLCEEGDCFNEQFTSVFRSDIDLKAHRASIHGKHLSKAATKQARTLELEFTLAPRQRPEITQRLGSSGPGGQGGGNGARRIAPPKYNNEREDEGAVGYDTFYAESSGGPQLSARTFINTMNSQDFPSLGGLGTTPMRPPGVTITRTVRGAQALARNNENFPALGEPTPSGGGSGTLRLSVNTNSNMQPDHIKGPNVSIHVNHKGNGSGVITTRITNQNSQGESKIQINPNRSSTASDAFPALSAGPVTIAEAQWVSQKSAREIKPKPSKVAPAPVLPCNESITDFPTLNHHNVSSNNANNNKSVKKSSSVTVPVSNAWMHSSTTSASSDTKPASTKNRKKKANNNNKTNDNVNNTILTTTSAITTSASSSSITTATYIKNTDTNESNQKQHSTNGDISKPLKKMSELKIDNLEMKNFPALGKSVKKPPPGFNCPPPPGLNNRAKPLSSDLTFTNSSGQKYTIIPQQQQFYTPPNFPQRNRTLIDRFISASNSNETIVEFKKQSDEFRNGSLDAKSYYDHCKDFLGIDFSDVFPELLALLPDVEKQQVLYTCFIDDSGISKKTASRVDICATCCQVVLSKDLRNHLTNHSLENHFPILGNPGTELNNSVWKK